MCQSGEGDRLRVTQESMTRLEAELAASARDAEESEFVSLHHAMTGVGGRLRARLKIELSDFSQL